jgi:hypothetical protein
LRTGWMTRHYSQIARRSPTDPPEPRPDGKQSRDGAPGSAPTSTRGRKMPGGDGEGMNVADMGEMTLCRFHERSDRSWLAVVTERSSYWTVEAE